MISLSALKARARAEHPKADWAYIPAEKGHEKVCNQLLPRVQHAGVRAQHDDMEHFYWANGDTSMRRQGLHATVYRPHDREPIATLYPVGAKLPVMRPDWTVAQRRHEPLPEVPADLQTWTDPA